MSISRVKTWSDGETLTHTDLNAEFDNVLNNATSLVSPFTATVDFNGNKITLDSDGDLHLDASTDDRMDVLQGSNPVFRILSSATSEDGIQIVPIASAASTLATIQAIGNSSVIGINFVTKGSGPVQVNGSTITTGGLGNIVEDTTPQLGGALDAQANDMSDIGDLFAALVSATNVDATTGTFTTLDGGPTISGGATISGGPTISGGALIGDGPTISGEASIAASILTASTLAGNPNFTGTPTLDGAPLGKQLDPTLLENLGIESSVTSSAITFTLLGSDGNTLSSSNPLRMAFRDATASTAFFDVLSIVSDVQLTVPDGATLGASNSSPIRAYLYAANDSGTLMPCIARQALFDEGTLQSVTAIASTADLASVLYGASNASGVPIRLIGQVEMTSGAVAGSWESTASVLSVWHPGMRKTGDVVQTVYYTNKTNYSTTSTTIPTDDTVPQNTEGDSLFDLDPITPTNALNRLKLTGQIPHAHGTADNSMRIALFENSGVSAVKAINLANNATSQYGVMPEEYSVIAGQTTAFTFKYRFGVGAGTGYVNDATTVDDFGDTVQSNFVIQEIYV